MDGIRDSALVLTSSSTDLHLISCSAGPHPLSDNWSFPSPPLQLADHKDPIIVLPVDAFEHPPPPPPLDSCFLHPCEMAELKVVMWNSGGLRAAAGSTDHKLTFFDKEFPQADFSIAAFLENRASSDSTRV